MTPSEARTQTRGQLQVAPSTLVFCVNTKDPDQNINVQYTGDASREAPTNETARKFLAGIEDNLVRTAQRQLIGFKKESSRMSDMADGVALELFFSTIRGNTTLKQRSIMLIAKRKVFTITCTSQQPSFDETNARIFDVFVSGIVVR